MALWQYTFHVLPGESVALSPLLNFKEDQDGFDDEPFWRYSRLERSFFYKIDNILPKRKSWSSEIDLYGNPESNCFEVLFEENYVSSVSFRIDFTNNYEKVLIDLIEFCILHSLIILNEELEVAPLNFELIKKIIENSSQVKKYNKLLDR